MRGAKVQASLRIRTVSPEPPLFAHTSNESRKTFRQKARSLAPLNGWTCAVKICHDGMLEDTNSLGAPQMTKPLTFQTIVSGHSETYKITRVCIRAVWPESLLGALSIYSKEPKDSWCRQRRLWSDCAARMRRLIRVCAVRTNNMVAPVAEWLRTLSLAL